MKKSARTFLFIVPAFFLLIFGFAKASAIDNAGKGISDLFSIFRVNIIQKIENDFCNQYILSISNGSWKADELRTRLGQNICSSYKNGNVITSVNTNISSFVPKENVQTVSPKENLTENNVVSPKVNGGSTGENQIIFWTNDNRSKNGLSGLSENNLLSEIAKMRVEDMFAKGYFEHTSPTGDSASKMAGRLGYKYITIGENIAEGNFDGAEGLVDAWMASPGHRANILNKNYTEIGVASEEGIYQGQKVSMSAQIFGKPLSLCSQPDPSIKSQVDQYKTSAENLLNTMNQIKSELSSLSGSSYNSKASEYNSDASLYNNLISEIRKLTSSYNSQVTVFNNCIKTQ